MRWFFLFLGTFSFLISKEIELFVDWRWEAKGQELFPLPEGSQWQELSIESRIRKKLLEKGWDIQSWELRAYQPWLLKWKGVHSWEDFCHWLGWGLPRKEPFLPKTAYWVFWNLGPKVRDFAFDRMPKEKMVLFAWEPPTVQKEAHNPQMHACFGKIFTWNDDLVDNVKYFKFYYPVLRPRMKDLPPFEEKKFCVLIASRLCSRHPNELYKEREKFIRFFEDKPGEFDLYGKNWEKRKFKNWSGGRIPDKLSVLKNYKFYICYENTRDIKGYVTEKIFDCFAAGVVPVYWGASNITDYVPADCFIDRRKFHSEQEVYDFLKAMTKEEYEGYVKRAGEYLQSEQAQLFSIDHFVNTFVETLTSLQKPSS